MAVPHPPRLWATTSGTFGKSHTIDWKTPNDTAEEVQLRAAQIQNEWSYQIHRYRKAKRLTISQLAQQVGMKPQRLGDALRGETPATLTDLALAEALLATRIHWSPAAQQPVQ